MNKYKCHFGKNICLFILYKNNQKIINNIFYWFFNKQSVKYNYAMIIKKMLYLQNFLNPNFQGFTIINYYINIIFMNNV